LEANGEDSPATDVPLSAAFSAGRRSAGSRGPAVATAVSGILTESIMVGAEKMTPYLGGLVT